MGAHEQLHNWVIIAFVVLLFVRARDMKFGVRACEVCGEKDEHLVGCPGRRGY